MVRRLKARPGTVTLIVIAALGCAHPLYADDPVTGREQMVVAANPHASEACIRILRQGGNAVDAAIAIQLVLSMVEPQSSGIGGGAFLVHFDVDAGGERAARLTVYSGRETAPASASPDMFLNDAGTELPYFERGIGGLAVGVPSVMRMLELAHQERGRLPWARLFEPAIELAETGFEISPRLYFLLDRAKRIVRDEVFKAHYYDADGETHPTGYVLVNEDYADTLRVLASEGAEAMYTGELAEQIVDRVNSSSISRGNMTLDDLASYRAESVEPVCSGYRRWSVCGPPLPSSGGITVQQILGLLEPFDLAAAGPGSTDALHLIAEAGRLAFADRNLYLGDPNFVDAPVEALLSRAYLRERSALIDPLRAMPSVEPGNPVPAVASRYGSSELNDMRSTSHFSIVDRYGDAVAMTSSVQSAFGSQLMVAGFLLNNQLTDFSSMPEIDGREVANRADAGKRPLSSMSPTVILDDRGRLKMLIGSPGGTRIINYVAQAIIGVLDFDLNIQDAVAAPHIVSQGRAIELEDRTALMDNADALRERGHGVVARNLNSGLHGITVDYGADGRVLNGGVDPRREGVALAD